MKKVISKQKIKDNSQERNTVFTTHATVVSAELQTKVI